MILVILCLEFIVFLGGLLLACGMDIKLVILFVILEGNRAIIGVNHVIVIFIASIVYDFIIKNIIIAHSSKLFSFIAILWLRYFFAYFQEMRYNSLLNSNLTVIMKKIRDTKQIRRNNPNFFKYMQPAAMPAATQQHKSHARSMVELAPSIRYQLQSARQASNNNKQNHHSSLCNHGQSQQLDNIKSKSHNKFLGLFGSYPSNNSMLANSANLKSNSGRQERKVIPHSSRQVFTCNIKNMNVNVSSSKQKDALREHKTIYVVKKDKLVQNNSFMMNNGRTDEEEKMTALKKLVEDYKIRQKGLKVKVQQLQTDNKQLKKQLDILAQQKSIFQQKYIDRERQLQIKWKNAERRNELLEKSLKKDKCKEHELIIESLKKVINEQLRKIIQLQKSKIEREQIQKLQERINQNMLINSDSIKEKVNKSYEKIQPIMMKRKESQQIKIQDENFDDSAHSLPNETHLYESIEQVNEEYEDSDCKADPHEDTILQQVDKYLSQWRNKY